MPKPNETFAQYLHRKRLAASVKRGLWMTNPDFHAWVLTKLPKTVKKPFGTATLYSWERGTRLPKPQKVELLKKALGK